MKVVINNVEYEYVTIDIPIYDKKIVNLVRLCIKKNIELIYGIGSRPVGILFKDQNEKIHPYTLEKLKTIDIDTYRHALNILQ